MKNKLIGICGVRIFEQNIMPFIQMLKDEADKKGFRLLSFIGSSCNLEETDEIVGQYKLIDLIDRVEISALLILTETIKNEKTVQMLLEMGRKKNIPVFSLDRKVDGCYSMLMDNGQCFEKIVRHVVEEHGCRYVNMISGDKGHSFSEERIEVYRKVLEENGIPFETERVGYGNYWERPVAGIVQKMFDSDLPFPEAIVCANDIMAHAAISALNEHGYEVPEDVIVTGYDATKDGEIFIPSITTGGPDFKSLIEFMLEEITESMKENVIKPCDKTVSVIPKLSQSCGCAPKVVPKNDRRVSKLLSEIGNGKWHMKALNLMLAASFGKQKLDEVFEIVQKEMDVFFDFSRYICINSEFLRTYETSEECTEVTNMLEAEYGKFEKPGRHWDLSELQDQIDAIFSQEEVEVVQVHLVNSGKQVFGFMLEGIPELVDWQIKHSDEFTMILAHIIQTTTYNFKMEEMNKNLLKANKEIAQMSLCDSMTKIYNRRGLFSEMQRIIADPENNGKYIYLFFVDMDGLKYINDNFGHKEGDFAIGTLAKVLSEIRKEGKVCARIGGDEFICAFVEDKMQEYTSEKFSLQMQELLEKVEGASDKEYPISASVGMIEEIITENIDLDSIINRADDKMYEQKVAKKKKRN